MCVEILKSTYTVRCESGTKIILNLDQLSIWLYRQMQHKNTSYLIYFLFIFILFNLHCRSVEIHAVAWFHCLFPCFRHISNFKILSSQAICECEKSMTCKKRIIWITEFFILFLQVPSVTTSHHLWTFFWLV